MALDPDDPKVRTAVFGKQVEDFLQTDIGDYLLQLARHEEQDALERLVKADPSNAAELMKIQMEVLWARKFQNWLGDAVRRGMQSLEMLQEEDV